MKCLAAKLAFVQEARTQGKAKTEKISESCHPADILTKPLQGKECAFKRGRLLGIRVAPPAKPGSSKAAATGAGGTKGKAGHARCPPPAPAPGT